MSWLRRVLRLESPETKRDLSALRTDDLRVLRKVRQVLPGDLAIERLIARSERNIREAGR